ncbi:MAG: PAS domain S-box protein [Leptospira sp.]|nr:PAS domain S-box protein [Leptospira sp.]
MLKFDFLELLGQPALVLDSSFKILYANEYARNRFDKMASLTLKEGLTFTSIFENSDYKLIGTWLIDLIRDHDKDGNIQFTDRIDVSEKLSIQLSFKKNFDDEIGVYWVIAGINVAKQIKEDQKLQLRYKEQLDVFKILFDMAPIGLGIRDFEGGFYKVNQGLLEITGYNREELISLSPEELFPDFKSSRESSLIHELIAKDSKSFRQEKRLKKSNGAIRIVSETINIIKDEKSNPFLVIVSYLDITEERDLQQKLLESRKMEELGKLSGGIAHDFNNMLLPVTLCSDIALQEIAKYNLAEKPELKPIKNYLEKISVSAQRAKTLIQKLFQYSQSGVYELFPIYLEQEIPKAMDIINLQKPSHINIVIKLEKGRFPILGESVWIEQVLENLIVNSFHSMKFKVTGNVFLRLFEEFGDVIMEVEDEGMGIEDEELNKIFQPFFTKKSSEEGTGIGMIVIQTMVHKMNGKIRVYSKPGKGTVFQIIFPKWNKIHKNS